MADSSVSIKITGSADDLLKAFAEVAASAGVTADVVKEKFAEAGVEVDALKESTDNAGGSMGDLKKKTDDAGDSLSNLWKVAIALGPALGTIAAVGTGALIGLVGAFGDGAVGLGAFALAADDLLPQVETQAEKMVTAFQKANAAAVMPALQGVLPIIQTGLQRLTPLVEPASRALQGLESQAEAALAGPFWTRFADILSGQTGPAITAFGHLIGGTVQALAGLDEAFRPLISRMDADLDELGGKLARFGANANSNTGIQGFMAYVEKEGPVVAQTLEAVGRDFQLWVEESAPIGTIMLPIIRDAAAILGDIEKEAPGLIELATALIAVSQAGALLGDSKIVTTLGSLPGVLAAVANPAVATTSSLAGLASKATAAELGLQVLGLGAAAIVEPAGLGIAAIIGLSGAMDHFSAPNAKQDTLWAQTFVEGLNGIKDPVAAVKAEIAALGAQEDKLSLSNNAMANGKTPWNADQYKSQEDALEDLQAKSQDLTTALGPLNTQQQALGDAIAVTAQKVSPATLALESLNAQMQIAAGTNPQLADSMTLLSTDSASAATNISTLTGALQELVGNNLDAQQAVLQSKIAIDDLSTSLKTAGTTMGGTNEQSLQAQSDATSWAQALYSQTIPALAKQGDTAKQLTTTTQGLIAKFDDAVLGSHATAGAVAALNAQYGLTPKDVSTSISLAGAAVAEDNLNNIQNYLAYLQAHPNTVVNVSVQERVSEIGQINAGVPNWAVASAEGRLVTHMMTSTLGESGPEVVLPLTDPTRMATLIAQARPFMAAGGQALFTSKALGLPTPAAGGGVSFAGVTRASSIAPIVGGSTGEGDIVINVTQTLDGKVLAKNQYRRNRNGTIRKANRNGTNGRLSQ